ncbi:hypothetical protein FPV67DRAFT_1540565 [Lyophyllum atratum]|nr:hypothetical protein FPV67DRAFT_1540565 [Lyophyllum atratum]
MAQATPDLKEVSALFNNCIARIRNRPVENLDEAAGKWLKKAWAGVMKEIETHYSRLSNPKDEVSIPRWAVNPSEPLSIFTTHPAGALDAYQEAFVADFQKLMADGGFNAEVSASTAFDSTTTTYFIDIYFPAALAADQPHPTSRASQRTYARPKFSAEVLSRITQNAEKPIKSELDEPEMTQRRSETVVQTKRKAATGAAAGRMSKRPRGLTEPATRNEPAPEIVSVGSRSKSRRRSTTSERDTPAPKVLPFWSRRKSTRLRAGGGQ